MDGMGKMMSIEKLKIDLRGRDNQDQIVSLFHELGFIGRKPSQKEFYNFLYGNENRNLSFGNNLSVFFKNAGREITALQLEDMVVLHRNDVSDANYIGKRGTNKYYVTSSDLIYWFDDGKSIMKWQPSTCGIHDLVLIQKPVKEYLNPDKGYKLIEADQPLEDWIEVPESAVVYISIHNRPPVFYKPGIHKTDSLYLGDDNKWYTSNWSIEDLINRTGYKILWLRDAPLPEIQFEFEEPINQIHIYYMVWNEGGFPPTFKHPTYEAAVIEAKRLARNNPGKEFTILSSICTFEQPDSIKQTVHSHHPNNDMPF